MEFIKKILDSLFKRKITDSEVRVEPAVQPVEVRVEPAVQPEASKIKKKTVNEGSPKNPDWQYIWDNLEPDNSDTARKMLDYNVAMFNKYKDKMLAVEKVTKIPHWFIAGITMREMSWDMNGCLHNGDPWNKVTKNVPKGLGPWKSWEEAAIHAINFEKITLDSVGTIAKACDKIFKYNGVGYKFKIGDKGKEEYSPYCVAYSNFHDETGKYKSDGVYDPKAPELQLGVITFWKELEKRNLIKV